MTERIQFMSDTHFEFLTKLEVINFANAVAAGAEEIKADYLALCGDITTTSHQGTKHDNLAKFTTFLDIVCPNYKAVLHLAGNHEYYHKNKDVGYAATVFSELALSPKYRKDVGGYYFLDNDVFITQEGNVIAGTTLWFSFENPDAYIYQGYLNDFTQVPGGVRFIKSQNEAALAFLSSLESVDLLLTHHGVTPFSHSKYRGSKLNVYYHTDISKEILRLKPKFVLHGHHHESIVYQIGETTVMNNPLGYNLENVHFDIGKYVEI